METKPSLDKKDPAVKFINVKCANFSSLKKGHHHNFNYCFSQYHGFGERFWHFSVSGLVQNFQNLSFMSEILKDATVWGPFPSGALGVQLLKSLSCMGKLKEKKKKPQQITLPIYCRNFSEILLRVKTGFNFLI